MSLPTSNDNSDSLATPSQPPSISVPNLETDRLSVALPRNDDDNAIPRATVSKLAPLRSGDEVILPRLTPIKPKLNYTDVQKRSGPTVRVHNVQVDSVEIGCKLSKMYQCQILKNKNNVYFIITIRYFR